MRITPSTWTSRILDRLLRPVLPTPTRPSASPRPVPLADRLVETVGRDFDAAIGQVVTLPEARRRQILQRAIQVAADRIDSPKPSLEETETAWKILALANYSLRLRIQRLIEALEGRPAPDLIYPLSGYDIIPSRFYPHVIGIDRLSDADFIPDPGFYYRNGLIREGHPKRNDPLERGLRFFFDGAALESGRFHNLRRDVLDTIGPADPAAFSRGPYTVFLKGLGFLRTPTPQRSFQREEREFALSFADHCTSPGDFVALHGSDVEMVPFLMETGRYEPVPLPFLNRKRVKRILGSRRGFEVTISPFLAAQLTLVIPNRMVLLRRIG